jgi:type IX secretion system PorP/SprF family membrane protein
MKTKNKRQAPRNKGSALLFLLLLLCLRSNAQFDQMFTQYMNNEMFINPAYTGTREALAATLAYRNQWVGIDGAPETQTFSIHSPIGENWGAGLSAFNEKIGISRQLRVNANYAYQIKFNRRDKLSFGLNGGIVNLNENFNQLILKDQNDLVFPDNSASVIAPNAGFGMYYYTKKYYIGFSIPRMIKNTILGNGGVHVKNSASPKDWHYYLTAAYVKKVSYDFRFKPSIMIKEVSGAPLQVELSLQGIVRDFWWIGMAYRTGDAISAITGFHINPQFRVFYSYDYSLSKLNSYNTGSHEITIGYDFVHKKTKIVSPRLF